MGKFCSCAYFKSVTGLQQLLSLVVVLLDCCCNMFHDLYPAGVRALRIFVIGCVLVLVHSAYSWQDLDLGVDIAVVSICGFGEINRELVAGFRYPGMYPKNPVGFFVYTHLKNPPPKKPHFYFNLILVYTLNATNNAIFYCF